MVVVIGVVSPGLMVLFGHCDGGCRHDIRLEKSGGGVVCWGNDPTSTLK